MNELNVQTQASAAKLRTAVFSMVAEGRLNAAEAKLLLAKVPAEPEQAPIAVIGMAGRFADCDDLDAYWRMIESGRHAIRPIAAGRWREGEHAVGGFLTDPDAFDALFFKISPTEAALMDPQQRLFLETAWLALEDAALSERDLAGAACGVFVGVGAGDYGRRLEASGVGDAPLALMGNVSSILAARIAYLLDLKGPALAIDTACSSSLVAVHLACEALRRGECDSAVAGGVCVINSGKFLTAMSQAGMISRSGRCHAFDSRADGFVCGEGAGAVVLKRLDQALRDGDPIHGVLLGNGINQDGRTNGITAPSAPSQEALERAVQRRFGIDPADIGYVEAHGTGTPLGDPIEVEALSRAFAARPSALPKIVLGSVKSNIGHALTAAGIAGLLKVLLMLRTGRIPPSSDFQAPNPRLQLSETPFRIAGHSEIWTPNRNGRRLATVSSFGFSGTNAHLVIADAPPQAARPALQAPLYWLLSARDPAALAQRAGELAAYWRAHPELRADDIAWTLAVGKTPLAARAAFRADSREQALMQLEQLHAGTQLAAEVLPPALQAWLNGTPFDPRPLFEGLNPRRVSLPGQIMQRQPCLPPNPAPPANTATDLLAVLGQETAEFCAHPDPALFSEGETFAQVETWGCQAAAAALLQAGLLAGARPVLTRAALRREFGVAPQRAGLFDALLEILARQNILSIEGDLIRRAKAPPELDALDLSRAADALRRQLPHSAPFLDLLQRSTAALPAVLRGATEGSAILFPEGRLDLVGAIYKGNRLADHFNRLMANAVAAAAQQRLNSVERLNILEVGAGTGGATAAILQALKPFGTRIHYVYTDVSLGFLKHGRDAFGDAVEPALFDATQAPEAQGFATGSFDLVIAANVLHAVPDLAESLGHLYRLLAPAGLVLLNEVTAVQDFATLTFGLTDGWWAFRDPQRRLPGAPLADPERWRSAFAAAGFPAMLSLGLPDASRDVQAILIAQRDTVALAAAPTGKRAGLPQASSAELPRGGSGTTAHSLEAAIREEAAQTLGMRAEAIDPAGRFMDYGVDSILGLDLINRLNRRYGLELAPTVVFSQPTVCDLARHLNEVYGISAAAEPAPPSAPAPASAPAAPARAAPATAGEPIAVIGMAGRFADADNLQEFHALLADGRSGIVPARERLGIDPDNPPEHLRTAAPYLRWGGLLKHIDRFDPMFFRISGREAELTDPQHRVFLTEVWRALEDAGYAGTSMEGRDCGIFVGCHGGDYTHLMAEQGLVPDAFAFTGNAASILAARIAYLLDLKGPALAVDTACSSSLVAVHLACQALREGECSMAIAGGVFINTTVGFNTAAASAGMLSPRGRCAAFDAEADGFVPGEGSGAVILKPLARAVADGDSIIAVIAGSATNQDGKTNGITAPNPLSQSALIRKAQQRAGIQPAEVAYIETHGTGTRLGDPIEIEGLCGGFAGTELPPGACLLGSVKSNVGHAAHAAGIAGLIKTLLSFRHNELYPSLHYRQANPALRLERTPFAVNTVLRRWPRPDGGRRVAGVSSFGFSGTNCHIILSDPPAMPPRAAPAEPGALLALSARSPAALERSRQALRDWLPEQQEVRLDDLALTLGLGRAHFDCRWAVVVADVAGLSAALTDNTPATLDALPPSRRAALQQAAQAYRDGELPDFAALAAGGRRIPLPTYPFEETSYWIAAPPAADSTPAQSRQELPPLQTPVWDIQAATTAAKLPSRLVLTGEPKRCDQLAACLQDLGVNVLRLDAPDAAEPDGIEQVLLCAARGEDTQAVLAPLFAWLRAGLSRPRRPLKLLYVHDGSPLAAAAIAAGPSLRFLAGQVSLRALALADSLLPAQAARHILAELGEDADEAAIDAQGQRRVRILQPWSAPLAGAAPAGGVWLLSGGLGGLGPRLAKHLGLKYGARIALLGRSPLQGGKAERLAELRRQGVQVHYLQADVADPAALDAAVNEIETVLGPVDAVLHAAGTPSLRGLADSSWQDMAATFAGKLEGARVLDRVLGTRPLRAFVLFSSLAAELGDFGQCDYAVANAFLGRFAAWRNREVAAGRRSGRSMALAWPIWEGGHAALGQEGSALIGSALGIQALPYAAGLAVLDLVLNAAEVPAEIAIRGDAPSTVLNAPAAVTEHPPMPTVPPAPASEASATGAAETLHAELATLIGRLLKLDPAALKASAGFGEFGFDSIALKEFATLLSQHYGIDISPAVFFAHGSIAALAKYLCATYPEQCASRPTPAPAAPPPATAPSPAIAPSEAPPRSETHSAVAVIGMAGRFPGAADAEAFWQLIETGAVAVGPLPEARKRLLGLADDNAEAIQGGFIDGIELFDPAFFRLSRREALHMDPQHRLALTATWQALEDAGIVPATLAGKAVGVFLGQQVGGYAALLRDAAPEAMAQAALGNANALMPNRISYLMDWRGPSESVDTACSSALVAVHRALRALRGGECELAVAGATSLLLDLKDLRATQSLGVLSPDGRCHSFDARANGYVKGEGIGVLVLKPLARALADGDPIHAVLRGSAVNHGGRAQSLTAPNPEAQRELIRAALRDAEVNAADIGYLESHGTGTELGDPVEIRALQQVFAGAPAAGVALGAVKANIGHLEPASGIAGLFKTILALQHRILPPVADLQTVNPFIELSDSALYLPREAAPWPQPNAAPRRAGVSAFGFGGANAHLIVEEAPPATSCASDGAALLVLSAPEPALLAEQARTLAAALEQRPALALNDLAYTLMCGRTALAARAALPAADRAQAIAGLRALAAHLETGADLPAGAQIGESSEDSPLALLGAESEDQAFFAQLATAGRFERLARFWVAGAQFDWPQVLSALPETRRGRRVHLPPTPLRRRVCWLEAPQQPSAAPVARPAAAMPPVPVTPAVETPVPAVTETLTLNPAPTPAATPQASVVPAAVPQTSIRATTTVPETVQTRPAVPAPQIAGRLREIIANALYIAPDELDDQARFMDLGLDSILAVEVTRLINETFRLQLQATRLYDFPSVADLAAYIGQTLAAEPDTPQAAPMPPAPPASAPAATVSSLPAAAPVSLDTVRKILAEALYIAPEELNDHAGFADLGLDSILAVEVTNRLNASFGTALQATRLYDYPTLAALAGYLSEQAEPAAAPRPAETSATLEFLLERVAAALPAGDRPTAQAPLDRLGIGPEQAAEIFDAIDRQFGVRLNASDVGVCRDLGAVAELIEHRRSGAAPAAVVPTQPAIPAASANSGRPQTEPAAAPSETPVLQELRAMLAALLWLPAESLEIHTPLLDLGLDRVSAQEFAERLQQRFGAAAPDARAVLAASGLAALAAQLNTAPVAPPQPEPNVESADTIKLSAIAEQIGTRVPEAIALHSSPAQSNSAAETARVEVAVVGIACRYPGAPDKDAFWDLLRHGRSGISRVPAARWDPAEHLAGLSKPEQREAVQWGGFVDGIERFDPLFFNLSPREAELMDPQQRLFLEEAWHAFEDAGLSDRCLKGARCGIFIGAGQGDYSRHLPMDDPAQVTGQLLLGNTASILVSRIAYLLDLAGPAVALDTACSSALVAAEMGFRAIRDGSCDLALVGGVNLMTTPQMHVMTAASGMLAPDGQCRTFDDRASGFVPGEGIGLLVLRRLDHALADDDRIYGLLRGAGTNQDGKTSGITAPSSTSQERLEREVWQCFGVNPADLGYIEAHGTGTRLGDPIEIDALTRAFAAHTARRQDCPIGSVKTNIGHTLASAGAAGLIKTLLALHHGLIPPSLHFSTPNRHIDFSRTPFFVPTEALPWRERRLAAVSSFGFSGTNAHLIVAAAPPQTPRPATTGGERLVLLSARDAAGLRRQAERLASFLAAAEPLPALADVAYTLACRRSHWEFRLALRVADVGALRAALAAFLDGRADARLIGPEKRRRDPETFDTALLTQPDALPRIGALWLQGSDIPWPDLYGGGRFIDLPVTVFAGMRCWIDGNAAPARQQSSAAAPIAVPAPAAPKTANEPAGLFLSAEMPVMANHCIDGRPILPGMASLALFHSAARQRGYTGPLSSIVWRLPVAAPACLNLHSEETGNELTLRLLDGERRIVAQAKAGRFAKLQPLPVELSAIRAACLAEVPPEAIRRRLEAGGVEHGAGFRLLERVYSGAGQVLAQLRAASPEASAPIDGAGLSPALLDSALQALGALEAGSCSAPSLLPAAVRQLAVHSIPTGPALAWLSVNRSASDEHKLVADLRLLDEQGEVLVELLGFEARPPQPSPPQTPRKAEDAVPPAHPAGELLLLRPHWQASVPPQLPSATAPLVLHAAPETAWAAQLVAEHGGEAVAFETLSPQALADMLAAWPKQRPLVFAAWREDPAAALDGPALHAAERRGVHALRRLLQALGRNAAGCKLLVVTRGMQGVLPEERSDPAFAALPGFARAAARELHGLGVSCIDLPERDASPETAKRDRARLLREPADAVVAYRAGARMCQALSRVLPEFAELPRVLPQHAVCLLLGGAGGLGRATSRRLADRYDARIAWIGRRPLDAALQAALDEISAAGGQALYLQADIADAAALRQAVETVRQRWGHIHLAWHGAIVLHDQSVLTLDAAGLDAVLAPKTHGLANLIDALTDDPPDFLSLCSSANAFTVNPGQANYAAACTFVDALALAQARAAGWQVRIANWGIWGETGIVAEERYLQRARQAGIEPLATEEGLNIFEWSLQAPQTQIIVVKVAAAQLAEMSAGLAENVRFGGRPAALDLQRGSTCLQEAFARVSPDSLRGQAETMAATIRYGRERLFRLYAELGLDRHCPAPLTQLAETLGIAPARHGLLRAHLDILARCGWLRLDDSASEPIVTVSGELPCAPPAPPPQQNGATRLLDAALNGTLDVLSGRRPATEILFPGGRNDLVEAVYRDDPGADLFNPVLAETVAALGAGRPLRIIEIGAGTGSASGAILDILERQAPGSTYTYTDVSPHFVAAGEARFGRHPNTAFQTLDIGRHPALQGITPGTYDLLIAANVLHALPNVLEVLGHAKALLKPNGVALLLEATARSDFATFTFGLTDGWWAFADAERRIPHSPLLSVDGWRIAAASRGLRLHSIGQVPGSDAQSILMLVSDGWLPQPAAASTPATHATRATAGDTRTPTADAPAPLLATLRRIVAEALRLDAESLDPDEPLERYGVDSLVINDIHARLEKQLGSIPRHALYEAVTLHALAELLAPAHATVAESAASPAPAPEPSNTTGADRDAIAVIGIAGRFPQADDIETFWDHLQQGRSAIGPLPAERRALWPGEQDYPGGYLQDVAGFDALFFNIAPNEAAAMDPQERLFLESAWSALENAGRLATAWDGKVGVFVGIMGHDYLRLAAAGGSLGDSAAWSVANRVSHVLNLNGPSLAVDTACSSALTALHLACESLRRGECKAALAGAVHLILHPASRQGLQALGMLSAGGTAKPFSGDADGMVGGEGVCCLVLRRLDQALADGDRILGTIRATALAANGRTRNYMTPNAESQAAGLRAFLAQHPIGAIDYVECQAVGSPINDAIEIDGLARALPNPQHTVAIGSVEGAVGHLEAASGAAQLAKVLGMFARRRWLPSVGSGELSAEAAAAAQGRFEVVRSSRAWSDHDAPQRALVQSFGAGGGSAFALLEAAPQRSEPAAADDQSTLVVPLSARTAAGLRRMAQNLAETLRGKSANLTLAGIAWTLQSGRTAFAHRLALWAENLDGLSAALNDFLAGRPGAWRQGERRGTSKGNGKGPGSSDPDAVAAYWAEGHAFDWNVLWENRQLPLPVSLPGYAFEHRHCWTAAAALPQTPAACTKPPPAQAVARAPRQPAPPFPQQRKLLCIEGPGEPEDLAVRAEAVPAPPPGEVLIEVLACGLNFADLLCARGLHPNLQSYPYLPGFEVSGTVVATGDGVHSLQPGERVAALCGGRGGLATHVTVPEHWAVALAEHVDPNMAAATPIGYLTMAYALQRAELRAGETILIQSAAGGTGPFAVQLALARGAAVIATAGSAEKLAALQRLGVRDLINYREEDFAARVRSMTGGHGVDVVLNTLGGDAIQKGIGLLAAGGRYCEIALAGLRASGPLDLSGMTDNQSILSINLGRLLADPAASQDALQNMAEALACGQIKPLLAEVFTMERFAEAFRYMDARRNIGKIILKPDARIAVSAPCSETRTAVVAPGEFAAELRDMAAAILGLNADEIDFERPLEEYGLNSIGTVALMRGIHQRFGIAAPAALVYESRCLGALAARLQQERPPSPPPTGLGLLLQRDAGKTYDPLVPVRSGSGRASFWLHGAPGDASWVLRLAEALGGDAPIYGIEARGVNGQDAPRRSVGTMAGDYIAALRRVQAHGPYRLGGYSGGGVIAYEMARQLLAGGETIDKLVLLDAYAPGNQALKNMGDVYQEGFIYQLSVNWFGRRWGMSHALPAERLQGLTPAAQLQAALDHLYRHAHPDVERERLEAYLSNMNRVGRTLGKAFKSYVAKPLAATGFDSLLIRCTAGMSSRDNPYALPAFLTESDYTAGWPALLGERLRIENIACDHFTLLDEPWLQRIATAIEHCFAAAAETRPQAPPATRREQVRQVVAEEIARVLMKDLPENLPPQISLTELGAHSVDRAEIAAAAMARLDVAVPLSALAKVGNIDGLIDLLTDV